MPRTNILTIIGLFFLLIGPFLIFDILPSQTIQVSWLHTEGGKIVDSSGNTVVLKGAALYSTYLTRNHEFNPDIRVIQAETFGLNTLRIPFAWDYYNPNDYSTNYWGDPDYRAWIDTIVQVCKNHNMFVILDFHSGVGGTLWGASQQATALTDPAWVDAWTEMWKEIANTYKGVPNVLYEIFNEPNGGSNQIIADNYRSAAIQCVAGIKEVNPNALILASDYAIGVVHDTFLTPAYSNIVYIFHRYYEYDMYQPWVDPPYATEYAEGNFEQGYLDMQTFFRSCGFTFMENNIAPVMNGEFGIKTSSLNWEQELNDNLRMYEEFGASWNYWYWQGRWVDSFYGLTSDGTTLTPQGVVLQQYVTPHTILGTATVTGTVIDAETSVPVQSASVSCGSSETTTNVAGVFTIDISLGLQTITITKTGYQKYILQGAYVESGRTYSAGTITLTPSTDTSTDTSTDLETDSTHIPESQSSGLFRILSGFMLSGTGIVLIFMGRKSKRRK